MNWFASLTRRIVPAPCAICGLATSQNNGLCVACAGGMRADAAPTCPVCALPTTVADQPCLDCHQRPPPFDATVAGLMFEPGVRHLIHALKYRHDTAVLEALCMPLRAQLRATDFTPDMVLLPMPLHPTRLRERGFNQAALIAAALARDTGLRIMPDLVRRTRSDPPQVTQTAAARRRALQAAFEAVPPVPKRVVVVDDVMTTGSSAAAVARVLKAAGAQWVGVWVVARTPKPTTSDANYLDMA